MIALAETWLGSHWEKHVAAARQLSCVAIQCWLDMEELFLSCSGLCSFLCCQALFVNDNLACGAGRCIFLFVPSAFAMCES